MDGRCILCKHHDQVYTLERRAKKCANLACQQLAVTVVNNYWLCEEHAKLTVFSNPQSGQPGDAVPRLPVQAEPGAVPRPGDRGAGPRPGPDEESSCARVSAGTHVLVRCPQDGIYYKFGVHCVSQDLEGPVHSDTLKLTFNFPPHLHALADPRAIQALMQRKARVISARGILAPDREATDVRGRRLSAGSTEMVAAALDWTSDSDVQVRAAGWPIRPRVDLDRDFQEELHAGLPSVPGLPD